jgi:hypothetical protein
MIADDVCRKSLPERKTMWAGADELDRRRKAAAVTRRAAGFAAAAAILLPAAAAAQGAQHFGGFRCSRDCISHAAGYRWAEREGIARVDDCRGLSIPFIEGCRVYVADPRRGAERDDEGRPIVERPRWPRPLPER